MDLSRYLALFVSEAGEHLAGLGADLVRLEAATRSGEATAELVDGMFRHAHSVKGMAASMEQDGIARVAHGAEDLLGAVRRGAAVATPDVVDALLAAVDVLQAMVARASKGEAVAADESAVARLAEAAAAAVRGAPAAVAAPAASAAVPPPPAPAPPPAPPASAEPPEPREPAAARQRLRVDATVAATCQVPAVRAFLVVKKLAALGGVVESAPTIDELRAGRIPGRALRVVVDSAAGLDAIRRALAQISELAEVVVKEADAARPAAAREPERAEPARTVRVRTELLDQFLDLVGELLLATARIRELGRALPDDHRPPLEEEVDRLHATVKDLHEKVMGVRMTPVALVTDQLPRAARDLARRTGKQVEVEVEGARIEIDRAILDEIADPLLHVLRNAVDHGIEPPHLRLLAGKPATGRIGVQARRERDRVLLEVSDDGKGMDPEKLRRAAVARGALTEAAAAALSTRECLMLACLPGLSTAEAVTDLSGRGVGMDAVKRAVEAVGGALDLDSVPGRGTRVVLRLPLTVAVQPVLLVRAGGEVVGLPIAKVHGATEVEVAALDRSRGEPVLAHGGRLVPVRELAALLGFDAGARARAVVIADGDDAPVGLAVEALLGQQEAVLKPVLGALERVPGLSAVTVLGNGRPVFILDVQRLLAA
jgi:two-component system chemotaxis sensor kinase CheA